METFALRRTQSLWGVCGYEERSGAMPDSNRWDRKSVLQLVQQYVPQWENPPPKTSLPFRNNISAFMNLKTLKCQLSSDSFEASESFLDFSCKTVADDEFIYRCVDLLTPTVTRATSGAPNPLATNSR